MEENKELACHIYKDADMAITSLEQLLKEIKEKDNKIKEPINKIITDYELYKEKSSNILGIECEDLKKEHPIAKISSAISIKKEVNNDNSDASLADMLIKGISMGTLDMEKKLTSFKDISSKESYKLAEEFLKFQEETINELKKYL